MNKYCCEIFNDFYTEKEGLVRRFSIIRKENGVFFFRYSSVDEGNLDEFIELLRNTPKQVSFNSSLSGEVAISFCPWCGEKLNL